MSGLRVALESRHPLPSVGLVCICGKAVASIEGVARRCECGRLWIVSATLVSERYLSELGGQ